MPAGLEQAMLALRSEVEWIDAQLARMGDERSRLIAALDLLEGPVGDSPARPASGNALTCPEPGCGRTFTSRIGLGVHARKAHHRPAGKVPASAVSTDLAAVLALLDHPEWVDGAVQNANGAWTREDGQLWTCSCGRAIRTLAQMRSHMGSVVDPEGHRPDITANGGRTEPSAPNRDSLRTAQLAVERDNAQPVTNTLANVGQPSDTGLPYGCACTSRFPTGRDWSAHVKAQPTKDRKKHRLTDQPHARIVPTGLPAPRPAVEPLKPAVAALQDRQKVFRHNDGGSIAAGASVIA